ncbi:MAG: DUF7151 family protein [Pseudomonadota bacterium]
MKPVFRPVLFAFVSIVLASCDTGDGDTDVSLELPPSPRIEQTAFPAGDVTCPDGGLLVTAGFDLDRDSTLDPEEILDSQKICNGGDGLTALSVTATEPAGINCATGGLQVDSGLDDDRDNMLDAAEVDSTSYVCNGAAGTNGTNGTDGFTSLTTVVTEAAGANCAAGGQRIDSGLDLDRDNILDAAEIDVTSYVCNGAAGTNGTNGTDGFTSLLSVAVEPAGANCAAGGQRLETGLDLDRDSVLDAAEISIVRFVCNGIDGIDGLGTLTTVVAEPIGLNCPAAGNRIDSGLDDDRDGILDPLEIDNTSYVCNGADGSNGIDGINGANGADGFNSLATVIAEPAGANCANGGQRVDAGIDDDRDGILDAIEIDSTGYVCNGAAGSNGADGFTSLATITTEPAGANCTAGGQRIDGGLDLDRDSVLDAGEITTTRYVCDGVAGSNGSNGTNGLTALTAQTGEPVGVNCAAGGQRIDTGLDDDGNGALDVLEIDSTSYVCNGIDGTNGSNGTNGNDGFTALAEITAEPAGVNCAAGGQRLDTGLDADRDGLLDALEVTATRYICNGADGTSGANGADGIDGLSTLTVVAGEPAGVNCATAGRRIDTGLDDDRDSVLDALEIDSTSYVCNGLDGFSALVAVSSEPPGANCADGGRRIDSGLDDSRDGILDAAEIDNTSYVCDGAAGANGSNGFDALSTATPEPVGANCATGGQRIDSGLDDDRDGILDALEIDNTAYVCNGLAGANGADGTNGVDGFTSLTTIVPEPAGVNCAAGGQRIDTGLDDNRDGILDLVEIDITTYVCNGADGTNGTDGFNALADIVAEPAGVNCAVGGTRIDSGLDLDRNAILGALEVTATRYVCNGIDGNNGADGFTALMLLSAEPAGANCAYGGQRVDTGLDDDRNGVLDLAEIDNTSYVCNGADGAPGGDGLNSLVTVTAEPVGANCANGGSRIDTGLDDDRDGILDVAEIDNTSYVCSASVPVLMVSEDHPELCLHGATLLLSGLDLNLNAVLDAGEVTSTTTICQGNAAPSLAPDWFGESGQNWFGTTAVYSSATRTYTIDAYDLGGSIGFVGNDANGDPLQAVYVAPPAGFNYFTSTGFGGTSMSIALAFDPAIGAGSNSFTYGVTDTEAATVRTVALTLHDAAWTFTPLVATEGTDTHAEVAVSFSVPLIANVEVELDYPVSLFDRLCDISGNNCQPLADYNFFCGGEVCMPVPYTLPVSLPAGTTSFLLRRPIQNDSMWGQFPPDFVLGLTPASGSGDSTQSFPLLNGAFTVTDDDPAPTVTFIGSSATVASGSSLLITLQSTQTNTPVTLLLSGDGANGVDYSVTTSINTYPEQEPGVSVFDLSFDAILNDFLASNLNVTLTIDTSNGLLTGANPVYTVTITPPPPRTAAFLQGADAVSRYDAQACASVQLSRENFIANVTMDVALGGTAVPGTDYVVPTETSLTIPAGQLSADYCVDLTGSENLLDVDLQLDISNIVGADPGSTLGSIVTLTGGPLPAVSFVSAGNTDLTSELFDSTCTDLSLNFTQTGNVEVTVDISGTAVESTHYAFSDSGFWLDADTRLYTFYEGSGNTLSMCVNRVSGGETAAGTAIDLTATIVGVSSSPGAIVGTIPASTFDLVQAYGTRYFLHATDAYQTESLALDAMRDGRVLGAGSAGDYVSGWQPYATLRAADGTRIYQTPLYSRNVNYGMNIVDGLVDAAGNAAVHFRIYDYTGPLVVSEHVAVLDSTGTVLHTQSYAENQVKLLAIDAGTVLILDNFSFPMQSVVAIDSAGTVAFTRSSADDGWNDGGSSCGDPMVVNALPASDGDGFLIQRRMQFGGSFCVVDADADGTPSQHSVARVAFDGTQLYLLEDAGALGELPQPNDSWAQDATGNLYLADSAQLMRISPAGVPQWSEPYVCTSCSGDLLARLSVSPNGNVARVMRELNLSGVDLVVEAFDATGVPLWTYNYDGYYAATDAWTVIKDDGSAVAGMSLEAVNGFNTSRIVSLDALGQTVIASANPYFSGNGTVPFLLDSGDYYSLNNVMFNPGYVIRSPESQLGGGISGETILSFITGSDVLGSGESLMIGVVSAVPQTLVQFLFGGDAVRDSDYTVVSSVVTEEFDAVTWLLFDTVRNEAQPGSIFAQLTIDDTMTVYPYPNPFITVEIGPAPPRVVQFAGTGYTEPPLLAGQVCSTLEMNAEDFIASVTVDLTIGGTVTAGVEYEAPATTQVTFLPGDTSEQFCIDLTGNTRSTGNSLLLNISNITGSASFGSLLTDTYGLFFDGSRRLIGSREDGRALLAGTGIGGSELPYLLLLDSDGTRRFNVNVAPATGDDYDFGDGYIDEAGNVAVSLDNVNAGTTRVLVYDQNGVLLLDYAAVPGSELLTLEDGVALVHDPLTQDITAVDSATDTALFTRTPADDGWAACGAGSMIAGALADRAGSGFIIHRGQSGNCAVDLEADGTTGLQSLVKVDLSNAVLYAREDAGEIGVEFGDGGVTWDVQGDQDAAGNLYFAPIPTMLIKFAADGTAEWSRSYACADGCLSTYSGALAVSPNGNVVRVLRDLYSGGFNDWDVMVQAYGTGGAPLWAYEYVTVQQVAESPWVTIDNAGVAVGGFNLQSNVESSPSRRIVHFDAGSIFTLENADPYITGTTPRLLAAGDYLVFFNGQVRRVPEADIGSP